MIIYLLLLTLVDAFGVLFSWLPQVTTLPSIIGIDVDGQLVNGVGMLYTFAQTVWPIAIVLQGMLVLMGYYSIKMVLRFFLGHRAPGATQ